MRKLGGQFELAITGQSGYEFADMLKSDLQNIGAFFKNARVSLKFTQEEVATHLGYSSKQIVSNWERGLCAPPLNQVAALISLFNLDANEVVELFLDASKTEYTNLFKKLKRRSRHAS